jgi:hypothetical protein
MGKLIHEKLFPEESRGRTIHYHKDEEEKYGSTWTILPATREVSSWEMT